MQTGQNTSTLIDGWLEAGQGSKTALITADDQRWTADQLFRAVCNVAAHLGEAGVGRGDRVLLVLDDTPAFPATFLGAMRIGAIPIPVNFLSRPEDFGHYLDDSGASLAVIDHVFLDVVGPQVEARPGIRLAVANGDAPDGAFSLDTWMADDAGEVSPVAVTADDMAFWLYSSGSTGLPKGVVHSHGGVAGICELYAGPIAGFSENDVVFSSTKMFHAYGLGNALSFPLWFGATAVYLTGRPTPDRLLARVQAHRPTILASVPALYNGMLADPGFDGVDWSSVRIGMSAAESLPPEIWRQFHKRTGIEILDGIGSTEMLHIYLSNRKGDVKPGTTGRPVDGYTIEIKDTEGNPCPPGEAGEMWVKGPTALTSYWNQPDRTRDKIRDGWFLTGDRYRQDEDGYYTYEGRVDDVMKVGGLWVSPIEIENRLMEHRAVSEAAVVSVTVDDRSRIKAFVILTEDGTPGDELTDELQQWCKAALLRYQFPHLVEYVDDFPRTATGKIQRFKLRG